MPHPYTPGPHYTDAGVMEATDAEGRHVTLKKAALGKKTVAFAIWQMKKFIDGNAGLCGGRKSPPTSESDAFRDFCAELDTEVCTLKTQVSQWPGRAGTTRTGVILSNCIHFQARSMDE